MHSLNPPQIFGDKSAAIPAATITFMTGAAPVCIGSGAIMQN